MRLLWRRAAGAIKDQSSIWRSSVVVSRRSRHRCHPDLEAAIIKSTSHDETRIDYKNAQRVFSWIRTSPDHVKPLVCFLSIRLDKTRTWSVAVKGLMLLHGVLRCKILDVENLGRLPFDLSTFSDAHHKPSKSWGYNAFVRAYFTFLDHKSTSLSSSDKNHKHKKKQSVVMSQLLLLQDLFSMLELLLQVRPQSIAMVESRGRAIVLEAMDCVVMEAFDLYSRVCGSLKKLLSSVHAASKKEAAMVVEVFRQSNDQGEELSRFFEFCKNLGVLNASEFPKIVYVPEDDIREFERIANGLWVPEKILNINTESPHATYAIAPYVEEQQRIMSTIITEKWEVFDDDLNALSVTTSTDTLAASLSQVHVPNHVHVYKQEVPDFITF